MWAIGKNKKVSAALGLLAHFWELLMTVLCVPVCLWLCATNPFCGMWDVGPGVWHTGGERRTGA